MNFYTLKNGTVVNLNHICYMTTSSITFTSGDSIAITEEDYSAIKALL